MSAITGATVDYTIVELLFMTLLKKTLSGDIRAIKLLDRYRAVLSQEADQTPGGFLVVPEKLTMEEFKRKMEANRARMEYEQDARRPIDEFVEV